MKREKYYIVTSKHDVKGILQGYPVDPNNMQGEWEELSWHPLCFTQCVKVKLGTIFKEGEVHIGEVKITQTEAYIKTLK